MIDIFKTIRDERSDFLNNEIEVVPGYNFSQYATIKKIHLYYNSQYEKGNYENVNGVMRKKVFHNLSTWRCEVATKMIDIDVRDFRLLSNNPETDLNVYLLEKELKAWLKKNEMGKLLNEISRLLPIYGSVVLEKTKDGAKLVDLRYLYNDQSAPCLDEARYVTKRAFFSHDDMRKMAKKGWEHTDEAIAKFSGKYLNTGYDLNGVNVTNNGSNLYYEGASSQSPKTQHSPLIEVWTRYGQVPLSWFTDKESDENEYVLAKYVVCGVDQVAKNAEDVILAEEGIVLYKEQIDELPFKEVHYRKTEGRWLGMGIVETLFETQRRINEIKNQEAYAIELASVQVFQTRDETVQSNLLTDLQNGDLIKVKSEITPIATESRNLVAFKDAALNVEEQANNLTFSRDVVSGENPPASATLGAVQIQTQQTTAVFDYKKENIGLFLEEFIRELVFPQIEKDLNKEHVLKITGSFDELLKLRKNYATNCANREIIDTVINDKDVPLTQETWQAYYDQYFDQISVFGDKIWTKVWANFFKNLDYEVDIDITGESRNVYAQIQNGNALLMAIGKDPTILQDPVKRKILFKILSNMGWHQSELESIEEEGQELQANMMLQNGQEQQSGGYPSSILSGQGTSLPVQ